MSERVWLEFKRSPMLLDFAPEFRPREEDCVALLMRGIPEGGGCASRTTFEKLIRSAFEAGVLATIRLSTEPPKCGSRKRRAA